jgi:WD40 repeat protein
LLHDKGEYGFYRTPELETTLNWQQKNPVTAQWASRYGQHFDTAMAFLQRSLQEQQAEQERERLAQQREIAQTRAKQRWLLSGLVLACALTAWAVWEQKQAWQIEGQRVVELFQSRLTHASLLAKQEDYAAAKKVLAETDALNEQVSPSLRHARNLLHSFTQIKGGEAEQVYTGAGYPLLTVAISPDGQLVAAGGENGTLVVFDVQTGKLLQRLLGHKTEGAGQNSSVFSIAFTPSGQQLISAGADKKIIVWQRLNAPSKPTKPDTQTGKPLVSSNDPATETASADLFHPQQILDAADEVNAISISPDGKLLASGGVDNAITLWDLDSGKKLKTLSQHRERISIGGLAFSPDGRYLASGSYDDTAIIWNIETGKPSQVLTGHTGNVNRLSFSADSATLVTASSDKTLRLWEVATGKSLRVFNGHQNNVFAVSWFGHYLLSGSDDRTIRLWDSTSGVSLRLLQGHESGVGDFVLYGGQLWSASNDGTVRRWSLKLPFQQAWSLPRKPFSTVITPALNHVAVGFFNGDLSVYDLQKPEPIWQKPAAHSDTITRLTVNHNGSLLATGSVDNAKIWQIQQTATGIALQESQILSGHKDAIHALAFSPDAQTLATASYDGQIGLFALNQTKPAQFINPAHQGKVASVEFDNTGNQLVSSGKDRSLKLWNLQTSPPTSKNFPLAKDNLMWSSISPDAQKLVSVGRENSVDIYNNLSTQRLYHLTGHENTIYRAVFAPDSQSVATVSMDTTVKFWQLEQGKELFSLALPTEFMEPSAVWDFDFRCLKDKCLIAVPLVRGQLQLYTLGYEGKLTEDANEQKRQQLDVWRLYQNTVDKLLLSNATQPALQASHETEQLAQHFNQQFPNDAEFAALKKHGDCQQQKIQQLLKPDSPALSTDCESSLHHSKDLSGF